MKGKFGLTLPPCSLHWRESQRREEQEGSTGLLPISGALSREENMIRSDIQGADPNDPLAREREASSINKGSQGLGHRGG